MGTYVLKPADIAKKWIIIDATGLVVGRLASMIAKILRGKNKASYTPHVDCGDNVIVINADKVALTGDKLRNKIYYWHTGYPGGIKSRTAKQVLEKFPSRILESAVRRMLPRGHLARKQMTNLRIYSGPEHPHGAQQPELFDFGALNVKNAKRSAYASAA